MYIKLEMSIPTSKKTHRIVVTNSSQYYGKQPIFIIRTKPNPQIFLWVK